MQRKPISLSLILITVTLLVACTASDSGNSPSPSQAIAQTRAVAPSPTPAATPSPTPAATPSPTPADTPLLTPAATPSPMPVATPLPTLVKQVLSLKQISQTLQVERAFFNLAFKRNQTQDYELPQTLTNLAQPVSANNYFFITDQQGLVLTFPDQEMTGSTVFLDIKGRVSDKENEEGLLGLAFDPEYKTNGYFYLYYSAASPRRSVVSRFAVSQNDSEKANPDSELIIMEIPQPFGNHNGGQLAFGSDGYLYISLGDGGGPGPTRNTQNPTLWSPYLDTLLGSILRIDVTQHANGKNYGIPPDNPFVGINGAKEEIWAYGLRNPWRFSFDQDSDTLWAGDVGQENWEEINIIQKGLDYGWNIMEGQHCFPANANCTSSHLELPIAEYGRSEGCSIIGGYVYRGYNIQPLIGTYIYGDFCSGKIWGIRYDGQTVTEHDLLLDTNLTITSFGQDSVGEVHILTRAEGVYSIVLNT